MRAEEVTSLPDGPQRVTCVGDDGPTPGISPTHGLLLETPWVRGTNDVQRCSAPETAKPSQLKLRRDGVQNP